MRYYTRLSVLGGLAPSFCRDVRASLNIRQPTTQHNCERCPNANDLFEYMLPWSMRSFSGPYVPNPETGAHPQLDYHKRPPGRSCMDVRYAYVAICITQRVESSRVIHSIQVGTIMGVFSHPAFTNPTSRAASSCSSRLLWNGLARVGFIPGEQSQY